MGEKKLLKLSDWSRGMITASSRMDLPPNALWYAENVDFSIPLRQGFLEWDAMLGSGDTTEPNPNHNTAAQAAATFDWQWTAGIGSFNWVYPYTFAGSAYMVKQAGTDLYYRKQYVTQEWQTLDLSGPDPAPTVNADAPVHSTGEQLLIPTTESGSNYTVRMWDNSAVSQASFPIIEIKNDSNFAWASLAKVRVQTSPSGKWYCYVCMKRHQAENSDETDGTYLPNSIADLYPDEGPQPWMQHWLYTGKYSSEGDAIAAGYTTEWTDGTWYNAELVGQCKITVTKATLVAATTGAAVQVEFEGHESTDGVSSVLTARGSYFGNYWDDPDNFYTKIIPPSGTETDYDWPDGFASNSLSFADNGLIAAGNGFHVSPYKVVSPRPPETVSGGPIEYCPSAFTVTPEWKKPTKLTYYVVYQLEHGGFTKPTELFSDDVVDEEAGHQAIAFQVWHDLTNWSPTVVRAHFFRVAEADGNEASEETWLFSADRETSQWITLIAGTPSSYLLAPTDTNVTGSTYGYGHCFGGSPECTVRSQRYHTQGDMGASVEDQRWASGISAAFLDLAEKGVNLSAGLKGGMGIVSFLDYGQDATESATTLLGVSLNDLMGTTSIDVSTLTLVGVVLGRAFYKDLGQGTVYYSEVDRFSFVPPTNYLYFQDAGQLVQVLNLHGYLLLLFNYKSVILDARTGLDETWSLVQELRGVGCVNANCVVQHESLIFWMGSGSIWQWDGAGRPERISGAIEYPGFDKDMTIAASSGAWVAVDPATKELLVYMGENTYHSGWGELLWEDTEGTRGKCMVYSIARKTWTAETFRGYVATDKTDYSALGKPFPLDNYLLIPCDQDAGTPWTYIIVRQGYRKFLTDVITHDEHAPLFKRQVLETGFMDLGEHFRDKKLKRLHTSFTAPLDTSETISAEVLDHWTISLYLFQDWEDDFGAAPWTMLSDFTADYTWEVADEDGTGYTKTMYRLNNIPSQQHRYVAMCLESAGTDGTGMLDENVTKAELGELSLSFATKEKI